MHFTPPTLPERKCNNWKNISFCKYQCSYKLTQSQLVVLPFFQAMGFFAVRIPSQEVYNQSGSSLAPSCLHQQ